MLQEARCAYVMIIMAVYWCTEVIPLAVTSLMPVVFFPLLGVQKSKLVRNSCNPGLILRNRVLCSPINI